MMPKNKILYIFSAGVLFITALLTYVCGLVGRQQYLDPQGLRRSEQQHSQALRQGDDKVGLEFEERNNGEHLGMVKKKAFSSNMRMVFAVGLEGTGHHVVYPLMKSVCKLETVLCPNMCGRVYQAIYTGLTTPRTTSHYKDGLASLQHEMKALAVQADDLNGRALLAALADCGKGQLSYPTSRGPDKPLQYVDIKILAREAERAGIDLRLVYLVRPAKDLLISDTQHRDFGGGFVHETRILINAAAVVGSAFDEVDPEFITCISFANITTGSTQAALIAEVVLPVEGAAEKISEHMRKVADKKRPSKEPQVVDDQEGWDLMANRLQEKLAQIERNHC